MTVRVKLLAYFRKHLPADAQGRWAEVELPENATPAALIKKLGIPPKLVSLILVNGECSGPGAFLKHDDEVRLLPPIPGG
jgi:sulfur carrier protein ThiS